MLPFSALFPSPSNQTPLRPPSSNMIPYALKLVWFCLSLTGIFACWYAFIILPGRNFGGLWGRLWYCIILTWLEAAFCLGLIYHMDPHQMPHSFCLFQTFTFSMAAFGLSGWCCSFSIATALAVLRPRAFNDASAALSWHPRYIPTLIVYPVCASVVYAVVVIKLDAVRPVSSDDLHCDVTDPIWVRLLGYGGVSPFISIPFLILSVISAKRLYSLRYESENRSTDPGLSTTQQSFEMLESATRNNRIISQPSEKLKRMMVHRKNTDPPLSLDSKSKFTERKRRNSTGSDTMPVFSANQHGDVKPPTQPLEIHVEKNVVLATDEASTKSFAQWDHETSPEYSGLSISPQRRALQSLTKYDTTYDATPPFNSLYSPDIPDIASPTPVTSTKMLFTPTPNAPRASQIIDFDTLYTEKNEVDKAHWDGGGEEYYEKGVSITSPETQLKALKRNSLIAKRASVSTARNTSRNFPPRKLTGAYRRMVLLQIGYFLVQLLAALSTVIDVGRDRLTPFGTQHVALIFAGWGPYIVYLGVRLISRWITI